MDTSTSCNDAATSNASSKYRVSQKFKLEVEAQVSPGDCMAADAQTCYPFFVVLVSVDVTVRSHEVLRPSFILSYKHLSNWNTCCI